MILVTGGTGLVGSHLLYFLSQQEEEIRATYRTTASLECVKNVFSFFTDDVDASFQKIQWVQADITDIPLLEKAFDNVDYVYHCAATISFQPKDYILMRKVNIQGTANVVNTALAHHVKKLCYVSSIAALGESIGGVIVDEETERNGNEKNHGYAISKFGAEMEVWRAAQEGLDVVIVNPGVILGGGFWESGSGELFSQVYNGLNYYTKGGSGFVGVNDVVQAMIQLMESPIKNERFILVAENFTYEEILFQIADAYGKKRPSIYVKPWMTNIVWRLEKLLSIFGHAPKITKHSAKSLHTMTCYSSEKIKKTVGIEFEKITEVVKSTVAQYRTT